MPSFNSQTICCLDPDLILSIASGNEADKKSCSQHLAACQNCRSAVIKEELNFKNNCLDKSDIDYKASDDSNSFWKGHGKESHLRHCSDCQEKVLVRRRQIMEFEARRKPGAPNKMGESSESYLKSLMA